MLAPNKKPPRLGGGVVLLGDAEDAAKCICGVFVRANRNGVDAHLYDWIIVAARLSHIAEVKDVGLFNVELIEQVGHTEDLVHAWSHSVDGSGAADFIVELWSQFFAALNNAFALLAVWVPSILGFGASFLAEGREGHL